MDQFTAHLDRGWDLVARGDFAGALLSARKGMELDGESPEVHNLIGYIHAAEGNAEDALEHYKQAVELDDTFVEAMLNAAEVLIHPLADFRGALTFIDDALELMDNDDELTDAMLLKIDALLATGDLEEAQKVARRLPTGPFEQPGLGFLVGRAKIEVGDVEGGAPLVLSAAEEQAANAEVQYYLGMVLESRGDHRGATVAFLRCRELDGVTPRVAWSLPPQQFERDVQRALGRLDERARTLLDGALVVVVDAPGAEVVADGVDPRIEALLDLTPDGDSAKISRVFVYQRNVERAAGHVYEVEDAIVAALTREIAALTMGLEAAAEE
jgi:Flp pilus assembly protein TadD